MIWVVILILIVGTVDYAREPRHMPSPSTFFPESGPPAPELDPNRTVTEQDCTKPIDMSAGNIRCK
jgi:hypothetical protein